MQTIQNNFLLISRLISFVIRSSRVNTQLQNVALVKFHPNGRILDIVEKAKTILYIVAGISDLTES